jgi:hypothetical protein
MVLVNDYAAFSAAVYGLYGIGQASTDKGWIRLDNYSEPSGLQAALFENSAGERVLAFRGADKFSASDWSSGLEVITNGTVPQQFNDALELYQRIATQYGVGKGSGVGKGERGQRGKGRGKGVQGERGQAWLIA